MTLLETRGLSLAFQGRPILDDLCFQLEEGERCAVRGHSGCGKSTLLRCLAGLERPDRGQIFLDGELASDGPRMLTPPWKRGLQMVFQDLGLWPTRTVLQNVVDARKAVGLPDARQVAEDLLLFLGLQDQLQRKPGRLSGGEARRLAFARALATEPRLLLLDEPFTSLDPESRARGFDLLEKILDRTSAAVLLVTHDGEEADRLGGRKVQFRDGRIFQL